MAKNNDNTDFEGKNPAPYWKATIPGINFFTTPPISPQEHLKKIAQNKNLDTKTRVIETCKALLPYDVSLYRKSDAIDKVSSTGKIAILLKKNPLANALRVTSTIFSLYNNNSIRPEIKNQELFINDKRLNCTYDEAERVFKENLKKLSSSFSNPDRLNKMLESEELSPEDKNYLLKGFAKGTKDFTKFSKQLHQGQRAVHNDLQNLNRQTKKLNNQLYETNKKVDNISGQLNETNKKIDNISGQLNETNKQIDNISEQSNDTNNKVDYLYNVQVAKQEEKKKQAKERAKQEAIQKQFQKYQFTLDVATFILGKFDPKTARIVGTVGSCALGIGMAIALPPPGIGTAIGIVSSILPVLNLFGGQQKDIVQARHEELMEVIGKLVDMLKEHNKQMHERFNKVHEHLQDFENNMYEQFNRVFNQLDYAQQTLQGIISDIKQEGQLSNVRLGAIAQLIKHGTELNRQIWRVHYDTDYKTEITLLETNIKEKSVNMGNLETAFKHIHKYAYLVSQSGVFNNDFDNIIKYDNTNALQNRDINYFMGYTNHFGHAIKGLPNLYPLADGVNTLIYFDMQLYDRYSANNNRNKVHLKKLLKKSLSSREQIQKLAQPKLIQQKYEDYKKIADEVLLYVYNEMRSIEAETFKNITHLPTTYHWQYIAYVIPPVFTQVSMGKDSGKNYDYRFFKESINDKELVYYTKVTDNVFNIAKYLGYIEINNFKEVSGKSLKENNPSKEKDHLYQVHFHGRELINTGSAGIDLLATFEPYSCDDLPQEIYVCLHLNPPNNNLPNTDSIFDITEDIAKKYAHEKKLSNTAKKTSKQLNYVELLYAALNRKFEREKQNLAENLEKRLEQNNDFKNKKEDFEKAATALLFYSTLNRICTNPLSVIQKGYKVDYEHEIFTIADMLSYVKSFSKENYLQTKNYWEGEIKIQLSNELIPLQGNRFIDVVFLRLYKQLHSSVTERLNSLQAIEVDSAPPILADTIQKLEWYRDLTTD